MAASLEGQLVVAISSRALFDFEQENAVFVGSDDQAYMALQKQQLDVPAKPGVAFSLVQKLLRFNSDGQQRVEVVILSRNDPVSQKEIDRNEAVYRIQNNRNPFIDYPQLAEYLWGDKKGEAFYPAGGEITGDPVLAEFLI